MNRSLQDIGGGLLLVPQFTLAADTRKGMRPSLTPAADPSAGQRLFAYLGERARARHPIVALGRFGARMQVSSPMMGRSHSGCGQGPAARRPVRRPSLTTTERIWSHGSVR
jgi:D-tyrosyl-tRNA(Tyr) deacylase